MSLTLLIVLITAIVAGIGFWFYNRRQINSLTETLEDKNAVITSFREHLSTPSTHDSTLESISSFDPNDGWHGTTTVTKNPEKKKQRYNNRPKKNGNNNNGSSKKTTQPIPEKTGNNKSRKPKKQQ